MPAVRRLLTALAAGALAVLAATAPAAAQDPNDTGWIIERFHVDLTVEDDGDLLVAERIDVDFAGLSKHGIYRVIPVRYAVEDDTTRYRVLRVEDIRVDSTAPDDVLEQRPSRVGDDRDLVLRIGDPETTVSGRQSYTISYRVRGALNAFGTHDELYWNVTGNGWPVPIQRASARLRGGTIAQVTCFRGPPGAPGLCDDSGVLPGEWPVWANAAHLAPGDGLTLVAGLAKGSVTVPEPLYEDRWTLARAFTGSPAAWPLAVAVALATLFGVARLMWRAGRDRAAMGGQTAAGMATGPERPRPLGRAPVVAEFRPPDGLRPAQLGLLLDERADPVDVSATIVDLAVRGHLVIEEDEQDGPLWFSRTDWVLKRAGAEDKLEPYEARLLDALFESGDAVGLSELKGSFAQEYRAVCDDIEADAVKRGWFHRKPTHTRTAWLIGGVVALGLACGLVVLLGIFTTIAMAGVPLVLGALAITLGHRAMPARTAEGSRVFSRAVGFRDYIRRAETGRMEFAEAERMFVAYLPYAVAFGAVDHWARTFAALGVTTASLGGWYVGHHMVSPTGGLERMSAGLSDFSRAVGGTLPTAPASSGSSGGGFSGGGFGGGGGGSW